MKLAAAPLLMISVLAQFSWAQTKGSSSPVADAEALAAEPAASTNSYTIYDATPAQEAALRAQIRQMHPDVLPLRVFFVPHWKDLDTARIFQLQVPAGYGSLMHALALKWLRSSGRVVGQPEVIRQTSPHQWLTSCLPVTRAESPSGRRSSFQLCVFDFGLFQDGNVRVSVFPKRQKNLVAGSCVSDFAFRGIRASEA